MGLGFARKEKARIVELEAEADGLAEEVDQQRDAHVATVEYLAREVVSLKAQIAERAAEVLNLKSTHIEDRRILVGHHDEQVKRLTEQAAAARGLAERDLARKDGEIAALHGQLATWRLVQDGHDWHKTHSVYVHGRRCDVVECLTCRIEPLAAARYVVPEGSWREP